MPARRLLRSATPLARGLVAAGLVALLLAVAGPLRPRWPAGTAAGLLLGSALVLAIWSRWQRERMVREAPLPAFLPRKLRAAHPRLGAKDVDLIERGLRQFFLACLRSNGKFVAMPSQAADALWHEFILHTRAYRDWCLLTVGRFVHHTPAEALGGDAKRNDGLRRAWYWACRDEAIDPRAPTRLPLLFALDAKLAIPNGYTYLPDCRDILAKSAAGQGSAGVYCGTSFSDGSASGDGDSFGGSDGGGDGGDGGGCGGD
jgi:hypothetical protein